MKIKNKTGYDGPAYGLGRALDWFKFFIENAPNVKTDDLFVEVKKSRSREIVVGYCKYPRGRGNYLIRVGVNFQISLPYVLRYAVETKRVKTPGDGTPEACELERERGVVDCNISRDGEFLWIYDSERCATFDELVIWILSHELWHYLCHTKQATGNYQTKANAYGFKILRQFKKGR